MPKGVYNRGRDPGEGTHGVHGSTPGWWMRRKASIIYNRNICQVLRLIRLEKDLSQKEFGALVGLSQATISAYEIKRVRPLTMYALAHIAHALKLQPSDICLRAELWGEPMRIKADHLARLMAVRGKTGRFTTASAKVARKKQGAGDAV